MKERNQTASFSSVPPALSSRSREVALSEMPRSPWGLLRKLELGLRSCAPCSCICWPPDDSTERAGGGVSEASRVNLGQRRRVLPRLQPTGTKGPRSARCTFILHACTPRAPEVATAPRVTLLVQGGGSVVTGPGVVPAGADGCAGRVPFQPMKNVPSGSRKPCIPHLRSVIRRWKSGPLGAFVAGSGLESCVGAAWCRALLPPAGGLSHGVGVEAPGAWGPAWAAVSARLSGP